MHLLRRDFLRRDVLTILCQRGLGAGEPEGHRHGPVQRNGGIEFNENMPLRNQPLVINTVPDAMALQQFLERTEWVSQALATR